MITAQIFITQGNHAQPLARISPAKLLNRQRTLLPHDPQPRGRGPSAHHRSTPCLAPVPYSLADAILHKPMVPLKVKTHPGRLSLSSPDTSLQGHARGPGESLG